MLVLLLLTAAFCLCQLFGRRLIAGAFKLDEAAAAICDQHLLASALAMPIFAIYFPANGMFQGVGEGFFATFCALLGAGTSRGVRLLPVSNRALWLYGYLVESGDGVDGGASDLLYAFLPRQLEKEKSLVQ
ncbi:MAG: MATE family efflux transporter [Oscillospiraceae bacterium]